MRIAAVIPYYNATGDPLLLRNHWRAVRRLQREPRVTVITARAVFERPKRAERWTAYTPDALWHKEGLINRTVRMLGGEHPIVAWIDSGVLLSAGWSDRLRIAVDSGIDVVQLFNRGVWLGADGNPEYFAGTTNHWGYIYAMHSGIDLFMSRPKCSAGMAWAATADTLRRLPLYDRAIVGGGDTWWIVGTTGCDQPEALCTRHQSPAMREHLGAWLDRARAMRLRVGWIDGEYRHLWHTDERHRQYDTRHQILVECGYDPARHTRIGESGLVEWSDAAPTGMVERVRAFVLGRSAAV